MLEPINAAKRVRIYVTEGDRVHGRALYLEILSQLRKEGASGATVFRGAAGFGSHHQLHTLNVEVLSIKLPLVIEWIDSPERVARLLPDISALVGEGLITLEDVEIVKQVSSELPPIAGDRPVSEVMTRDPERVFPDTPIRALVELLIAQSYRALPVIDRDGRLVGIVTNGDLVERGGLGLRTELLHILDPGALEQELRRLAQSGKVAADVMTTPVTTVAPDATLAETAHLMATRRLKRLPIVDAGNHLLGIISRVDVLRTLTMQPAPAAEEPRRPVAGAAIVADVITQRAPAVKADAPLPEVLGAIVSTRLNRAVVVDDAMRPVGVVSDAELMRRLDPLHHPSLSQVLMRRIPFVSLSPEERQALRSTSGTRAADLMLAPSITVRGSTPIAEAARNMIERRYKILPVVDEEGKLIGLIDRADLLRAVDGR